MRVLLKRFLFSSNGFTLIEILVVFSVIGLLTGVGFAGFVAYSRRQALDQAAFDMKLGIEQVKQMAVSRVKPANIPTTTVLDRYRIVFCNGSTSSGNCYTNSVANMYEIDAIGADESITPVLSKTRPSTVTVIPSGACVDQLRFYILKATDNVSCTIKLRSTLDSTVKTICVDRGGNATINNGDVSCP